MPLVQALPSPQAAEYEAFVASGRHLYSVRLPRAAAFTGERGKEGVYIAEAGVAATAAPLDAAQHRAEVQHVSLHEQDGGGEAVLASVDCYGRALLARMRRQEGGQGLRVLGVHQLQPADLLRCGRCACCQRCELWPRAGWGCAALMLESRFSSFLCRAESPGGLACRWRLGSPPKRRSRASSRGT